MPTETLFNADERKVISHAFNYLEERVVGEIIDVRPDSEVVAEFKKMLNYIAKGREIVARGTLEPADMQQFSLALAPELEINGHALRLESECQSLIDLRNGIINILRQAILFSRTDESGVMENSILRMLSQMQKMSSLTVITPERASMALQEMTVMSSLRKYYQLLDMHLILMSLYQGIRLYSSVKRDLAEETVLNIQFVYASRGKDFWSRTAGGGMVYKEEARRLVHENIEKLHGELMHLIPFQSDQNFNFPWRNLDDFESDNLLHFGYEVELDNEQTWMESDTLRAFVHERGLELTEADMVWILMTVPPTENIWLALRSLSDLKVFAAENEVPSAFLDGFVSNRTYRLWQTGALLFEWEEVRYFDPQILDIMHRYVNPAHRSTSGYQLLTEFLLTPRGNVKPETLAIVLNALPAEKWERQDLISVLIEIYTKMHQMIMQQNIPGGTEESERRWVQIEAIRSDARIPTDFMYLFLHVTSKHREQRKDLFLVTWRMLQGEWALRYPLLAPSRNSFLLGDGE